MALTEKKYTIVDGIDEAGNIHVKEVTQIIRDGVPTELKSYHRKVVSVGDDITNEDSKVKVAATAMWDASKLDSKVAVTVSKVQAARAEIEAEIVLLRAAIDEKKAKKAAAAAP